MKLGIPLLVIGILMLFTSIPYSIMVLLNGFNQLTAGSSSGGFLAYTPLAGVIIGLMLTTIGASRVFKN
jgi:hypothetical protein